MNYLRAQSAAQIVGSNPANAVFARGGPPDEWHLDLDDLNEIRHTR
jgi:hypothetical protein